MAVMWLIRSISVLALLCLTAFERKSFYWTSKWQTLVYSNSQTAVTQATKDSLKSLTAMPDVHLQNAQKKKHMKYLILFFLFNFHVILKAHEQVFKYQGLLFLFFLVYCSVITRKKRMRWLCCFYKKLPFIQMTKYYVSSAIFMVKNIIVLKWFRESGLKDSVHKGIETH